MALTTQQSNKAMVLADCEAMKEFLEKAQAHANRQVSRPVCLSDQNPLLGRRQYVALNWHVHPAIWLICLTTAWTWKLFMWSLWFLWFCHHLAAQGSLDLKYLAQRFEKGKAWVDDWMSTNHRYFLLPPGPGFSDVQAALVNFAHLGIDGPRNPNPLLDLKKTEVHLPTGTALLHCADRSIIDCDPVPGLCLSSWISVCGRHVAWLTFHLNSMIQVSKTSLLFRNYIEHCSLHQTNDWLTDLTLNDSWCLVILMWHHFDLLNARWFACRWNRGRSQNVVEFQSQRSLLYPPAPISHILRLGINCEAQEGNWRQIDGESRKQLILNQRFVTWHGL